MNITRGKMTTAQKVVVYGPEGIGKSTFASQFPMPIFIDTEGSTKALDVARFDAPKTWQGILDLVDWTAIHATEIPACTLVIDTIDWAERLCVDWVCEKNNKTSIEDFGYGKGYTVLADEFAKLLRQCDHCIKQGVNVVLTAHAQMRKFEQPDEMGAYDRFELKCSKKVCPLIKEWCDMLLFVNYETLIVESDNKKKAKNEKRVMYTSHRPCWDAKNRHGLPDKTEFTFDAIAQAIPSSGVTEIAPPPTTTKVDGYERETIEKKIEAFHDAGLHRSDNGKTITLKKPKESFSDENPYTPDEQLPFELRQLMQKDGITAEQIQAAVSTRGKMPADVPLKDYPEKFINGYVIRYWNSLVKIIKEAK